LRTGHGATHEDEVRAAALLPALAILESGQCKTS
jgi:hypothetical protein